VLIGLLTAGTTEFLELRDVPVYRTSILLVPATFLVLLPRKVMPQRSGVVIWFGFVLYAAVQTILAKRAPSARVLLLFVLTTVMSHPTGSRAVVDAGLKAHSVDSWMPLVAGVAGARHTRASDEHGVIELDGPGELSLGQKIRLIPGHCDPTVNLHDWFVCFRGDRVEAIWPITARGAFY
jgi:D-serine deaminase-like pyridoxal phosphate-dependent protein